MDINHTVLQKLFDIGFNVKTDYTTQKDVKLHRAEELKSVIEKGFKTVKILVEKAEKIQMLILIIATC